MNLEGKSQTYRYINSSQNFLEDINQDIFNFHLDIMKKRISEIFICNQNISWNETDISSNPFLNLEKTIVISNHKYIFLDPIIFLILSSYWESTNSIIRSVIWDNLMPKNKVLDFLYYCILYYGWARIDSKSSNDILFNMWILKKQREVSIENNNRYNQDLSFLLDKWQNIWISWTNGRTKESNIDIYRNLERLHTKTSFNILPVNLDYKSNIYDEKSRKKSIIPKSLLDIIDISREINNKNVSLNLTPWELKPFSSYSKDELEEIIFNLD